MRLANGNTINLNSVGNDILINGEKGHLAVNRGPSGEGSLRGKFVEQLKANPADKAWLDAEVAKLYRGKLSNDDDLGHMINFFNCVKDRSLPISDVYSHCNSVNACHTANIAMLLDRKVKWDPREAGVHRRRRGQPVDPPQGAEPYTIKV